MLNSCPPKELLLGRRWAFLAIAVTVTTLGCGSGKDLGAVEGRVTRNGQPVPDLWVEFRPAAGRPAEGRTDKDGHYVLRYTIDKYGTEPGENHVRISSGGELDSRDHELSPRKEVFSTHVDVVSGSNVLDFELSTAG